MGINLIVQQQKREPKCGPPVPWTSCSHDTVPTGNPRRCLQRGMEKITLGHSIQEAIFEIEMCVYVLAY